MQHHLCQTAGHGLIHPRDAPTRQVNAESLQKIQEDFCRMFPFQKLGPNFEKIEYKRLVFEMLTSASLIRMSGLV